MSGRPAGLVLAAALLAGCESMMSGTPADKPAAVPSGASDPALVQLTETALRSQKALSRLARIRAAESPQEAGELPALVPAELLQPVTIDWTGPLNGFLERLAELADYQFLSAGPVPIQPVIVVLASEAEPLIVVLRDAGLQATKSATVSVDPTRRMIRLDWARGT